MKKNFFNYYSDCDKKVFDEEFDEILPKNIFDSHIHLWKNSFIKKEISGNRRKQNPFLDPEIISGFTYQDFKTSYSKIFPNREINGIIFGLPLKEIDLDEQNTYIAKTCKNTDNFGLYIPKADMQDIPSNFLKDRFIGFKPYPDLVDFKVPEDFSKLDIDVSIFQFISKKVLEFSNEYGLILLIHIPRKGRLNDIRNLKELTEISRRYRNIKIVLAHAGRSYCYTDIKDSINTIKKLENIYVDTAMINNISVNKVLLQEMGSDRILFGSDSAMSLLKGKNVEINNRHYFVTKNPKDWSISSEVMQLDFTFFIYEIIRAIKLSIEELGLKKEDAEKIFYSNSKRLIENIIKNIR